ncbi:3168_t:CDS:2 [Racocetra fulgida]|uniref:3168_t:CDS:1 n=1 Tax=Racocetra fulgida TaxID=60492 RepID=A0A9N8WL21_9GLOM|nr:3168_t:CDS:2 [Racocetra fulgida]
MGHIEEEDFSNVDYKSRCDILVKTDCRSIQISCPEEIFEILNAKRINLRVSNNKSLTVTARCNHEYKNAPFVDTVH